MGVKIYTRICPRCSETIVYSGYRMFWKARKNESTCRPCFYRRLVGHKTSEETRRKIGAANKVSLLGNVPPNKGVAMSEDQKKKLSAIKLGKKMTEECKKKHRINRMKRCRELGIPLNEDRGAREFLAQYNKKMKYDLKPKYFFDIGYIADGYDDKKHVWLEFDPPHHYYVDGNLKPDDVVRQTNIISHFEKSGKPLNKFIRVSADKIGSVISIKTVYTRRSLQCQ